jgi:predicted nucleic acid-binding protein
LGLAELRGFIQRHRRIALDTSVFIYQMEANPRYVALTETNRFYGLLGAYPHLDWVTPSLEIADIAAVLRARHRFKPLDAIQAATAIKGGATALITNDAVFERVELFETAVLDRFHPKQNS